MTRLGVCEEMRRGDARRDHVSFGAKPVDAGQYWAEPATRK